MRELLAELAVAGAERDYGAAVGLLRLAADVLAVIDRDAGVLSTEVPDVPIWRSQLESALAEQKKVRVTLVCKQGVTGQYERVLEMRCAVRAL